VGPFLLSLAFLVQPSAPVAELSLRLLDPKPQFQQGELIEIEARIAAPPPSRYQFSGFLLSPGPNCDKQHACSHMDMRTWWKLDPILNFGMRSATVKVVLNEYVPRLPPGKHTARLRLRAMELKARGPRNTGYGYVEPPQYVVSNPVEFQIVPASKAWIRSTVAEARRSIVTVDPQATGGWEVRRRASTRLRYIDHPLAWEAALDLEAGSPSLPALLHGLFESSHAAKVCELMRERIPLPAYPVREHFLNTMAAVCAKAEGRKEYEADFEFRGRGAALLASALPSKIGQAKIETLLTLLRMLSDSAQRHITPPWAGLVPEVFATSFADAQPYQLRSLLGWNWPFLLSPQMESILERIIVKPARDATEIEIRNLALKRLCELNPEKGRKQLLSELRDFRTSADLDVFELLPPDAVGNIDDLLIENLARAQSPPYGDDAKVLRLIARYGTPQSLERFKEVYEMQRDPCGAGLIAYFLRAGPAHAGSILKRQAWDMHAPAPPCTAPLIAQVPPLHMHRVMEEYLSAFLQHSDGDIKGAAARALGRYGSAAAEQPLWQAYRYFHDWWKNRREDLEKEQFVGNVHLEQSLRNALARGSGWLTDEAKLKQIDALCLGAGCLRDSAQDLGAWREPLRVTINLDMNSEFHADVAHYCGIRSLEALQRKLAQFPRGTVFQTFVYSTVDDARKNAVVDQLRKLAAAHEFKLVPKPSVLPR
jgi:hypothetical protein